ncbi:ATP-binding cassette domain-containing protein, partial [Rhizobium leguminosarum]|uniref:ATP-binding cassette domain-containing protein n=1 Tax=Rhizobium leguminosarum TaxID=384 RepID=UPI003F9A74E1
ITKTFPGVKALENVNLKVLQGEIHALVCENGAGKSTLMKVLSGVYPTGSYEGDIFYEGETRNFKVLVDDDDADFFGVLQDLE